MSEGGPIFGATGDLDGLLTGRQQIERIDSKAEPARDHHGESAREGGVLSFFAGLVGGPFGQIGRGRRVVVLASLGESHENVDA
jgi:hypothetical protein